MKRVLTIIAILFSFIGFAQEKPLTKQKSKAETKQEVRKKESKKKVKSVKAGKTDPNEKGSGITIPVEDQPKLDARPNPAATVPSTVIPTDGNPKP